MSHPLHSLMRGDLRVEMSSEPEALVLSWFGKSHERDPSRTLTPYLTGALEIAHASHRPLELRFEELDYFNSATVSVLIAVLRSAREQRVPMVITFDAAVRWQSLSFDALRVFESGGLLKIRAASPTRGPRPLDPPSR